MKGERQGGKEQRVGMTEGQDTDGKKQKNINWEGTTERKTKDESKKRD